MKKFLTILWAMFIPYLTASAQDEMTDTLGETDNDPAVSFSPTYAFRSLYSMLLLLYNR